ncbi:hypothetical protein MBLNU459_g3647t1 [Dothideomycetes sp. NU459]
MNGHHVTQNLGAKLDAFRRSDAEREALVQEDSPFILALIDGDGAIFHDHLYKAGSEGGADAAHELHQEIRAHVAQQYPDRNTSNWAIVLHIYYNMEGLSHKLRALGILKNPNEMAPFARAFGLNQPLFSFIDVGSGKERADHKVRETLRLFLPNSQCKHIIFAGCHDNGYLPTLDPYKRDPKLLSRISLLETLPMQPGFQQLGFTTCQFPSIFRSENLAPAPPLQSTPAVQRETLPTRTNSYAASSGSVQSPNVPPAAVQASKAAPPPKPSSPAPSTESTSSSWATVGKIAHGSSNNINIATRKAPARRFILLNAYDERLDPEIPRVEPAAQQRLYDRIKRNGKVCNGYHLNGKCESGQYCDYDHGERLSPGEQLALKHRARTRSCLDRGECRDFLCTNGHVCPYGKNCYSESCWFQDVHDTDLEPVSRIFENGDKEWLKKPAA